MLRKRWNRKIRKNSEEIKIKLGYLMALFGFKIIPTSKIIDNVFAIKSQMVNFFLYVDRDNIIAVDAGTKNKATLLELKSINIDPNSVKAIFLTHGDNNHVGGVGFFPNAKLYITKPRKLC